MYEITKQFAFSAAHHLSGLPPDHPCSRQHGHNYVVEVVLASGHLDQTGFVEDYGNLKLLGDFINADLDHRDLNTVFDFQPSAENIARFLFAWCAERWPKTVAVRISETPKTWAEFRP